MPVRNPRSALAPFLLAGLVWSTGCSGPPDGDDATPLNERTTIGDTTFVRVGAPGPDDEVIVAVEELAIGQLEGPDEYTFGSVTEILPDDAGGVYVFDGQAPALRYYGADGTYVRTIGGQGGGPGEYEDAVLGLSFRTDGRLVLRDARNGRVNVYEPDGSYADEWPLASGLFTRQATVVDTADHVFLKIMTGRPEEGRPWPIGMLHLDPDGEIVDTIPPPSIAGEPTSGANGRFIPTKEWALSRFRDLIIGVSDSYAFEIRRPHGPVIRVTKEWDPVVVGSEEKAEWQATLDWQWERSREFMSERFEPIPDTKPAYQGFYPGLDGSFWVHVHADAEKREVPQGDPDGPPPVTWAEPRMFDVFSNGGDYLGRVVIPARTNVYAFALTDLWGIRRGEFDEIYVVRLGMGDHILFGDVGGE
ncbi:MAG: 6-bladed beta-propeller [Gemmatimonadota bacterium]|nr:6-bladed beta-propeller [Gemmatimonadota bacterium]